MAKIIINVVFIVALGLVSAKCVTEQKAKTEKIFIELYPGKIFLQQRHVEKEIFETELKLVVDKKIEEGFERKKLTIVLKVHEDTKRGEIADLETYLRRLNVRKVLYLRIGRKQSS